MNWQVFLANRAEKQVRRLPSAAFARISSAIEEMKSSPLAGDTKKLEGFENVWRKRIGEYRIIFELFPKKRAVFIYEIARRTTATYRS